MKKYEVTDLAALVELGNWRQVGSGQLAASVDKEASKRLVKNGRFAGRNGALIDLQAGRGWLVDMTAGDRAFAADCPAMEKGQIKKLLGLIKEETRPAGYLKEAGAELQKKIISFYDFPVALEGVSIMVKEENSGKYFESAEFFKAEEYAAEKTPTSAIFYFKDIEATEVDFEKLADKTALTVAAKNSCLLTEAIKALKKPVKAAQFRSAKEAIKAGKFDPVELSSLITEAGNHEPGIKNGAEEHSITLLKRSKPLKEEFKKERKSEDEKVRFLSPAAFLLANLPISARKLLQKPAKEAQKPATKEVTKDTGFTVVTLDRKTLHIKPAAVKEKVIQGLTAERPAKKPATNKAAKKSKSSIKLEKAQEDAQAIDVTAAEFLAFCARINAGRQKPYSARNCELIFAQTNGAATDVRGFKSWIKAGRAVKKGQKSIVIEAPRFVYDEQGQPVLDKHGKPKMYAVPCCVFDIAQTEELKESKEA